MTALEQYYQAYISPKQIVTEFTFPAEHCIPTLNYGEECTVLGSPYIGNCNIDAAGTALQQLYGSPLNAAVQGVAANLKQFDQTRCVTKLTACVCLRDCV